MFAPKSTDLLTHIWSPFPKALIFDFDGLMVDTEYAIYTSWQRVYAREGLELPLPLFNQCLGSGYTHWDPGQHLESLTGKTYNWDEINNQRQEELEADLAQSGTLPGVLELINYGQKKGLLLGVSSSSSRRWVQGWLERLNLYSTFGAISCRTDGYKVKPAPDLFLATARALQIDPKDCLVFEDSKNGIAAAKAAQMKAIAVPNRVTAPAMPFEGAYAHVHSLLDILPE